VVNNYSTGCYNCGGWNAGGAVAAGAVGLAAGTAIGASVASANTAAATSAAYSAGVAAGAAAAPAYSVGAVYPTLPSGCAYDPVGTTAYYNCGGAWFKPAYGANGVYYSVVAAR
jgi:hypothetical protein